jgi:branched-chain amino acid transport system ATP-binding protein
LGLAGIPRPKGRATVPAERISADSDADILRLDNLKKLFGGLEAVSDFSLNLRRGELKGLIGPNGAGKSTVFNLISGMYRPSAGHVWLAGEDITGWRSDIIAGKGVARTFQAVKLLENRTVLDTLLTALFLSSHYHVLDAVLQTGRYRRQEAALTERALAFLALLGIEELRQAQCNELPYGLQRKVSIAVALCLNPQILLLDEPMAGLSGPEKTELCEAIRQIKKKFDLSIILVEHDMKVIMTLCDAIAVMNNGRLIAHGPPAQVRTHREVIQAYLGKEDT